MTLALGFIAGGGGVPEAFVARVFYWSVGCLPRAFSGSSSGQRLLCILGVRLRIASWLWLGIAFSVAAFVCFLFFPLPPLPIRRSRGLSSIVFSIELTVQCDGCLIWGLGWRAGLVAGLRVGQAYGVSHRPGFGLLVSVPRSLSTQPPFATQPLILIVNEESLFEQPKYGTKIYINSTLHRFLFYATSLQTRINRD